MAELPSRIKGRAHEALSAAQEQSSCANAPFCASLDATLSITLSQISRCLQGPTEAGMAD